jgi:ABC-type transport system involved in multi-copper enzyme maturation permease subunit
VAAGLQVGFGSSSWLIPLYQIGAIIRYEFLMQWRRVALPALGIAVMVPAVLGAFLSQNKISRYRTALATGALSLETITANITAEMMIITWLGTCLVIILMLPVVVADTIPKDQHLGVQDVLASLPLGPGCYLIGKVLSLWLGLALGLGLAALVIAGVWRAVVGPFNPAIYAELWLLGVLPLALINAGLASLLAAWQPTNQRAMLVGAGFSLLCLLGLGLAFVTYGTFWDWLNPARPALLLYYFVGWPGAMQGNEMLSRLNQPALDLITQLVNRSRVGQSLLFGAGQVGLVWLLVWQWRRRISP